jgi:putative CRISPR-associated protein (TIGR02619 family)
MRNTLICTVGTSLFDSNLKNLSEKTLEKPENWQLIKKYYDEKKLKLLAKELLKVYPNLRICGAEINTIEAAKSKKWLNLENLIFLVSDTDAGRDTGKVLEYYYKQRTDLKLKNVEVKDIENLQDPEPKKFKTIGLRNLVSTIGDYLSRFGTENCAIDATGGYKAQIAIAVLIGQALDIPVYYKHERFNEIIDFPPLPFSLDFDILGRNAHLLTFFEKGNELELSAEDILEEKLKVFLDDIEIEGKYLFELNAFGQLLLTTFRLRNPKAKNLFELSDEERKEPTFRDDHYPKGFKEFVNKIYYENKWIKTAYSLSYHKQKSISGIEFFVKNEDESNILVGTYSDKDNFGARFRIVLSHETIENLNWAAEFLNRKYNP